jgi:hypothetical protein
MADVVEEGNIKYLASPENSCTSLRLIPKRG